MPPNSKQTHVDNMRRKYEKTPLIAPVDVRLITGFSRSTINRLVIDGTLTPLCTNRANGKRETRRFELENVLDSFKKTFIK